MTIDVQVFHDKLDLLKEWMDIKIDSKFDERSFSIKFWECFNSGFLLTRSLVDIKVMPFEEFYNQKIKIQITK